MELTDITYTYPDRIVHLLFYLCSIAVGVLLKRSITHSHGSPLTRSISMSSVRLTEKCCIAES